MLAELRRQRLHGVAIPSALLGLLFHFFFQQSDIVTTSFSSRIFFLGFLEPLVLALLEGVKAKLYRIPLILGRHIFLRSALYLASPPFESSLLESSASVSTSDPMSFSKSSESSLSGKNWLASSQMPDSFINSSILNVAALLGLPPTGAGAEAEAGVSAALAAVYTRRPRCIVIPYFKIEG
eukprot:GHVU01166692.1.p2 GENE.GHVU01166692.1~~GHVU01166692.1.p2  ORF type:complete len:181 (+),score=9.52 GHVU01166692.1:891-1433(+)